MVNFVPVSRERHRGKGFRRPADYAFSATQAVVPLVGVELAQAAIAMPIAFIEQSRHYLPVAVMSPAPGRNLFVAPNGQWLGSYIPAALRSYPFRLLRAEGSEKAVLCIDEDGGWVVNVDADTEKFFEEDGSPSATLKPIMEFLEQIEQSRLQTDTAVGALADAHVIHPWPLTVTVDNRPQKVDGLHCIDEAALNGADSETFLMLRQSSSLVVAYAQLMSMQNVAKLASLARTQQQLAHPPAPAAAPLAALDVDGMIRFN